MALEKLGRKLIALLGGGNEAPKASFFKRFWQESAQFHKICDLLPYDAYDRKTKLFYSDETVGFVIETHPLVGSSVEMQKELENIFAAALPEGSSFQVMLWADPHVGDQLESYVDARKNAPNSSSMLIKMAEKRAEYLKSFAYDSPFKPFTVRNFRCFFSVSLRRTESRRDDEEICERIKSQLMTTLEMLSIPGVVWGPEELLSTLDGILNNRIGQVTAPKIRWNPFQRLSDHLSCSESDLKVKKDELLLHDETVTVRTYGVRSWPNMWSLHAMSELIGDENRDQAQIPCPFIIHYGLTIPVQDKQKTKYLAKASWVEKQAASPIGKYISESKREAEELGFLREEVNKGERIVQTHFGVILMAKPEEIDNAEQILNNLFISKEWKLEKNKYLHLPMFLSSFPCMWGSSYVQALLYAQKLKTTVSTESGNLLPIQGEWKGTKTPGMLLVGKRGQVKTWSPFDNDAGNYNVAVVGRSGSGKSVFMQEMVASMKAIGGRVFIFDVGRSFEKLCEILGGEFMEFSAETSLCINPFSTIPVDNPEIAGEALSMLKSVLPLMAAPKNGVSDKGASLLEQAMLESWNTFKNETTITHIADWLLAHKDKEAQDLGMSLFPYTKDGSYGRFFNGPSTVNLDNPFIVIEMEELKERKDLQAVVVQMLIVNITNKMFLGDRKTPFQIVFDEAWDLLQGGQGGSFMEMLARRLRKYRGGLVVGTQSLNDFYQSPGARAVFENSDTLCMLSQRDESIDLLKEQKRISMTPQKEAQLKSVKTKQGKFAEIAVITPNGYSIERLLLDPFSLVVYSTKPEEYAAVKDLKNQGFTMDEAVSKIVATRKKRKNPNHQQYIEEKAA